MIFLLGLLILVLTLLGTPLFIVISAIALYYFYQIDIESSTIMIDMYRIANAPVLIAIPLFTFAGYIMAESKTPQRLVNLSRAFLGWMPGGLAVVAIVACSLFTAFTGASGVTIIALGGLLYPALKKEEYPEKFALGVLTTSGSRGLLFPPSLPIIIFGFVSGTHIDKLFAAGIVPGTMVVVAFSAYSIFMGKRSNVPKTEFHIRTALRALREAAWEVPLPIFILGGIYGGILTVSEAAAFTAFYVLIVEVLIYRDLPIKQVPKVMRESMLLVGGILIILGAALGFTNYLVYEQVPMKILEWMKLYIDSKIAFLMLLNVFLLVVGCMMDIFSALIVVVPLIVPIAKEFDINMVHLGIIFLTNLEIGFSTPPVGMNLFIASFRFKKPVVKLYAAALPFLVISLTCLVIITYWEGLSLWLVNLLDFN